MSILPFVNIFFSWCLKLKMFTEIYFNKPLFNEKTLQKVKRIEKTGIKIWHNSISLKHNTVNIFQKKFVNFLHFHTHFWKKRYNLFRETTHYIYVHIMLKILWRHLPLFQAPPSWPVGWSDFWCSKWKLIMLHQIRKCLDFCSTVLSDNFEFPARSVFCLTYNVQ